ncbi:C45 family autoproteolytic acyltransferase/hydolase [Salegentibacter salegens]|uniref:Predicted choloylglycine hydrolase n=1 Tax=Salegentibacter salegens TaxID=143223 RepID=A0A1M7JVX6_9FLAO|nr:C45 family peptidase [Salegentibacter salegens]PRX51962.1 putative choloylglycine hydrolase [Salegentibacter salegens]SHM57250.1 Predicted choloylglycine hydrolase [Salegentibacter salegens]
MQLHFNAISEPEKPGSKWQKLYKTHWPAYKSWLNSKGTANYPDLKTSQAALKKYMPEMWPTYQRLCKLAKGDKVAARFLTGFQPPAYISGCSQAVTTGEEIQLVRNYDFHPDLMEGTQLLTSWNNKKVIATSDCLIGVVDGMNEDGLAISLTFGGRKEVGVGFGIPFILRYVLEFCSNVDEAVAALIRIPSHMSYNVTVVDKTGKFKTVQLAPDKAPLVTDASFTTNHQGTIDWPENAAFNKTQERSSFLNKMLSAKRVDSTQVADAFLKAPLYNTKFKEGFGTLFTSVYRPLEGKVVLRWPQTSVEQSFENFQEVYKLINYEPAQVASEWWIQEAVEMAQTVEDPFEEQYAENVDWQETVTEILVNAMAQAHPTTNERDLEKLRGTIINNGEVSWQAVAGFWSKIGTGYADSWKS